MKLITKIKALRHEAWIALCHTMPIEQNKVILWADDFKSFGCSPKQIALQLAAEGGWDVVWALEQGRPAPADLPEGIRLVRHFSMEYLKEIATAKFIVCNHRTGKYHYFRKRKGQVYIQTWHSSLRLKKIEGDAPQLPASHEAFARADSEKIDLLLSGCGFSSDIFRRAFWYDGEILESGTPRCDVFFRECSEEKRQVFAHFGIPEGKKLALYAPTFRSEKNYDYGLDFAALQKALGDGWVIGCRLHPNLNAEFSGDAIPMSRYPDMQQLLLAAELLITDYSSSMFDMAVAGKKCCLFAPDLRSYMEKERGLYFDIRNLPFPLAETMEQLCRLDWADYEGKRQAFLQEIRCFEDGHAAKKVADWMRSRRGQPAVDN